MNDHSALLVMEDVVSGYGPVSVLEQLSLSIGTGSRTAILGRNGVGKSTTLKTIMGLADTRSGRIVFDGNDITRLSTHERARLGIGYVPQTRDVFPSLTVEENLISGLKGRPRRAIDNAYRLFPRLAERRRNGGTELSGGEQQMLSVARALLGEPRLLLLDEPLEGLAPILCEALLLAFETLAQDTGMAILIVEQQVHEALGFAEQALILEHGSVVHADDCSALLANPDVLDRHVGVAIE